MSMTDIDYESAFDGVITIASMLCLRPDQFRTTARAISRALKPNGHLLLTLNEPRSSVGRADDTTTHTIGETTVYARAYTEAEVRQAFAGLGMDVEMVERQVIVSQVYGEEHVIAFVMTKVR
jgi:hypothetical protein